MTSDLFRTDKSRTFFELPSPQCAATPCRLFYQPSHEGECFSKSPCSSPHFTLFCLSVCLYVSLTLRAQRLRITHFSFFLSLARSLSLVLYLLVARPDTLLKPKGKGSRGGGEGRLASDHLFMSRTDGSQMGGGSQFT